MKVIQYGDGDPAWIEPENETEEKIISQANEEKWTFAKTIAELNKAQQCVSA